MQIIRAMASLICLVGVLQTSIADTPEMGSQRVRPCRDVPEASTRPITKQCAAAAIAEDGFLKETHHRITKYSIFPMKATDTQWRFMVLLGDEKTPAAPGEHYMIFVDRATGKTDVTPGK